MEAKFPALFAKIKTKCIVLQQINVSVKKNLLLSNKDAFYWKSTAEEMPFSLMVSVTGKFNRFFSLNVASTKITTMKVGLVCAFQDSHETKMIFAAKNAFLTKL